MRIGTADPTDLLQARFGPTDDVSSQADPVTTQARASAAAAGPRLGHNGGPPLDGSFVHYCWKLAWRNAWKNPPREVILRRLERARALGMTYREYTAIILDRGVHL